MRRSRVIWLTLLASLPGLIFAVVGIDLEGADSRREAFVVILLTVGFSYALAALILTASTLRDERDAGTLPYIFMRPIPRLSIAISSMIAGILAAATIAVVYPHMNGIGGDNFWLFWDARAGRLRALCGAGRSAGSATIEWYAARGVREAIPARGGLAALTVPGVVDGWWQAHRHSAEAMGSPLGWDDLLADAIVYAREGFSASAGQRRPPESKPSPAAGPAS